MEGNKLKADIVAYSIIIEALFKAGKIDSATDVFSGLSSKGVLPDVWTYSIMIKGLCDGGIFVEAEKLFREMEQKGCSADGCTYNTIIRGFLNNNETLRATSLIEEMCERGFSGDASTMELIFDLLLKDKVDPVLSAWLKDSLFHHIENANYEVAASEQIQEINGIIDEIDEFGCIQAGKANKVATLPVHAAGAERSQFLMLTGFNPRSVQAVKCFHALCSFVSSLGGVLEYFPDVKDCLFE
ncbi:PREDICTED: pentatricopeptide repeat-containing protein At1g12620-like [Fragaria vesca subsp. vesca]